MVPSPLTPCVPHRPHHEAEEASGGSEIPGPNRSVLHGHGDPLGGALEPDIEPGAGAAPEDTPGCPAGIPRSCGNKEAQPPAAPRRRFAVRVLPCSVVSVVLPMFSCVLCSVLRYPKYLNFVFFISTFIRAIQCLPSIRVTCYVLTKVFFS